MALAGVWGRRKEGGSEQGKVGEGGPVKGVGTGLANLGQIQSPVPGLGSLPEATWIWVSEFDLLSCIGVAAKPRVWGIISTAVLPVPMRVWIGCARVPKIILGYAGELGAKEQEGSCSSWL